MREAKSRYQATQTVHWAKVLAVLGFCAISASHCGAQGLTNNEFVQYRDSDFRFTAWYPKSWAEVPRTHAQTRLAVASNAGAGPDDFNVVVTFEPSVKDMTPAEYISTAVTPENYLGVIRQSVRDAKLIEHGRTSLSSQDAYYFILDVTRRSLGLEATMRQMQVLTARNGYQYFLTFRTDPDKFAQMLPLFQLIAVGFVLHPDSVASVRSPTSSIPTRRTTAVTSFAFYMLLMGLVPLPAILARYVFLKRPISKLVAFGVVAPLWLAVLWLHHQSGAEGTPHWLNAGAVIAFVVLIRGDKERTKNKKAAS